MGKIGDLCEIPGEVIFEWKIKDFFQLPDKSDICYESPKFYFSGASWEVRIFPNGETRNESCGWISLYLARMSTGFPVTVSYSFSFKTSCKNEYTQRFTQVFDKRNNGKGVGKYIQRSVLMEKKSELVPSDVLTVVCTMKNNESNDVAASYFSRLEDISDNLLQIYAKKKRTDFQLKFNEETLHAHRVILETRSSVFAAMFSHDTKENQTGEVSIVDIHKETMGSLLQFIYSGDMDRLNMEDAFSMYVVADKYDIKGVKEICLDFIIRNLSVEWVCDALRFAELHQEEELSRRAKEYLKENANEILESEKWKKFVSENHTLSVELLGSLIKELVPKKGNEKIQIK